MRDLPRAGFATESFVTAFDLLAQLLQHALLAVGSRLACRLEAMFAAVSS